MSKHIEIYETWLNGNRKDARRAIEAAPVQAPLIMDILEYARGQVGMTGSGGYLDLRHWFDRWPDWSVD